MKVLLLDNYDSFTYMLKDLIEQCGINCSVIRNDDPLLDQLDLDQFAALVISPGPQKPIDAGKLNWIIEKMALKVPVLGICLGHQALGEFFGANLCKAKLPRHGKVDLMEHNKNNLFKGVPQMFRGTRYHSLVLKNLPEHLIEICKCEGEIMGFAHKTLPVWGLQFHPESCQTQSGIKMLENFFIQVKKIAHS